MKQEIKPTVSIKEIPPQGKFGQVEWVVTVFAPYKMRSLPRSQGLRHVVGAKWVCTMFILDDTSSMLDFFIKNGFELT